MAARVTAFVVFAIVAVTFVAGLIVGAQRADDSGPIDLIVYNARVYTGTPDQEFAEAIAIRGNRILRVGSNREIKRLMRRATTVIDAHGGTVTAGFHDGRVDLKAAGLALETVTPIDASASGASALNGASQVARAGDVERAAGRVGGTSVPPPAADASAPSGTGRATAHRTATETARANQVAPLNRATTGLSADAGADAGAGGDTLEAIRRAIGEANRVGVTSVGITARTPDDLLPYDTLLRTRELTARVTAALTADWPLDEAGLARLEATRKRYEGVPFFKVEAVRLRVSDGLDETASGRISSRMGLARPGQPRAASLRPAHARSAHALAAVRSPGYARLGQFQAGRTRGAAATGASVPLATEDLVADLSRTIALLDQQGWQVILETADEGDATLAVSAVESMTTAAKAASPPSDQLPVAGAAAAKPRRVRLELAARIDDATVARLTKLGIVASVKKPAATPRPAVVATATDADGDGAASAEPAVARAEPGTADTSEADPSELSPKEATADASVKHAGPNADPEATDASGTSDAATTAATAPEPWPYANLLAGAAPFIFHSGWPAAPIDPRLALSAVLLDNLLALADEDSTQDNTATAPEAASAATGKTDRATRDGSAAARVAAGRGAADRGPADRAAPNRAGPDRETLSKRLARAINAYTRYAAYASAGEDRQGTVAKEMLADLVIFSADLFTLPPDKLLEAEVTTTIFDGKVVYTRQPDPAAVSSS